MTLNPFIALGQDPIGFFALLGYALLMLSVSVLGTVYSLRSFATLYIQYLNNRHTDRWFSIGDMRTGVVPPAEWAGKAAWSVFVLALSAWAIGGLAWVIGG